MDHSSSPSSYNDAGANGKLPRKKRPLFYFLLSLFLILSVVWIFYFPYSVESIYRAIPENAIFISEHPALAGRWKECVNTPVVRGMLNASGVQDKDIDRICDDQDIATAIKLFAAKNTVIAYVPRLDVSGQSAWVFASWAGVYTQPLRWGLLSSKMTDFSKVDLGRNRVGWAKPLVAADDGLWLSVTAVHGLVLGCISTDATGVRYLVDRVENTAPIGRAFSKIFQHRFSGRASSQERKTLDRIWMKWRGSEFGVAQVYDIECALALRGVSGSSGWLRTGFLPKFPYVESVDEEDMEVVSSMIGDRADLLAFLPLGYVDVFMKQWVPGNGMDSLTKAIRDEARDDSAVCAAMLGSDFVGRIAGMKVASVLVGFRMKDGADGFSVVNRLIDVVNRDNKASLIPRRETGVEGMISVGSARPGALKLFGTEYRPTFLERDGWLILFSSRMALEKFLREKPIKKSRWVQNIDGHALAYAMADLVAVNDAVNGAASVAAIIATAQGLNDEAFAMRLHSLRAWMHVLARQGECRYSLYEDDGMPVIQCDFGIRPLVNN